MSENNKIFTLENVKSKALQLFGGLFMEKKEGKWIISVGRVSWWLTFIPALYIWISGGGLLDAGEALKDISPNHLTTLLTLAAYNFSKKALDFAKDVWGKNDGPG